MWEYWVAPHRSRLCPRQTARPPQRRRRHFPTVRCDGVSERSRRAVRGEAPPGEGSAASRVPPWGGSGDDEDVVGVLFGGDGGDDAGTCSIEHGEDPADGVCDDDLT